MGLIFRYKTVILSLFFAIFSCACAYAQEHRTEAGIYFRQSQSVIDVDFQDNGTQLRQIVSLLDSIATNPDIAIRSIEFCGAASPEGSSSVNRYLSNARLHALEEYVKTHSAKAIPDSVISHNDHYIPWHSLAEAISVSDMEYKAEVLDIISRDVADAEDYQGNPIDGRIPLLKELDGGKVWRMLLSEYFSSMRHAYMVMITYVHYPPVVTRTVALEQPQPFPPHHIATGYPEAEEQMRHWYLKTNAIGWGLAVTNIAVEFDMGDKWSFQLPIYYSGYNYFTSTIKFRTFTIQPEVRYWFKDNAKDKFFVGAHLGMSYYNFAIDGNYRIQDKGGNTPALGGGVSVGYRMPISKSGRWKMEFSVGGGVYSLEYDKFHNTDKTSAGALSHTIDKKTWFGLDHAAVSFAYMFNLKRKQK